MKLVNRYIDKHGAGHVTLRPEDNEDMWHLYNLISEGDSIRATALRRVQNISSTGSTESHRVRTNLTIQVSKVEFSPSATPSQEGAGDQSSAGGMPASSLHISGPVISENQYVRMGAYHTLDIEPNRDVRIEKLEGWDSVARSRVEEAIVPGRGAEVAAVVCGEGTAAFCLLSQHMTIVPHRISMSIPRKAASAGTSQHEKGLGKFYAQIYESFLRHIPYNNPSLRAIVIASPGWIRDAVFDYVSAEALKRGDKPLQKALKEKVLKVHINSPHVHSLVEVLKSPEVSHQLKEAKFAKEGIALDRFFKMLGSDENRAWYGPDHVRLAAERGAIGTLLISDDLFRSSDPATRKKYVAMVEAVQRKGGEVIMFSSMHESGQQLNQLTGVAAILTFPLDVEVVEAEEKEEEEERKRREAEADPELVFKANMSKRPHTPQESDSASKRARPAGPKPFNPIKVATPEAAAAVDANPPLKQLVKALGDVVKKPDQGDCVVYWMRMHDLRNNRAFSNACEQARRDKIPVIVLFVFSPQDWIAHDRGARKIDFTLRNLAILKKTLADMDIPLHTVTYVPRKKIPEKVLNLLNDLGCKRVYANIEYEVDELRRDIELCKLALPRGVQVDLSHNKAIVEPGVIFAPSTGKPYAVYSPYKKQWLKVVNDKLDHYLKEAADPTANDPSVRESEVFGPLFETEVPTSIPGFELDDVDKAKMAEVWPAGESAAREILLRFLNTKARTSQLGAVNPLTDGSEDTEKHNRVIKYGGDRDRADKDTTSRLSPYFSSGVISVREVFGTTMKLFDLKKIDVNSNAGVGTWFSEIIWRDFYTDVLASFPRVSMGRPFQEKFSEVVWENHQSPEESKGPASKDSDSEALSRWKQGKTGVPIVDAAMRCVQEMGWVHNRPRMIVAMYLTKHLMIDWRVGERYFMENLIDGDLASNNGGWQWSASTGVDPCPYFRIFNPHSQSTKTDPSGDFIRNWVPELSKVRGPDLHTPSTSIVDKLKYPRPIIDHKEARERALRRYKNPGST